MSYPSSQEIVVTLLSKKVIIVMEISFLSIHQSNHNNKNTWNEKDNCIDFFFAYFQIAALLKLLLLLFVIKKS